VVTVPRQVQEVVVPVQLVRVVVVHHFKLAGVAGAVTLIPLML
jgi:hypothetical protein